MRRSAAAPPAARAAVEPTEQPQKSELALMAALHLEQERYRDAVPILHRLIAEAPRKKTYWLQLSAAYGQLEDDGNALAVLQVAYNSGLLTESAEILRLADLLLFNESPERAAAVIEESMAAGRVALDEAAYSKLASSWLAAEEFQRAIPALEQAGELGATGAAFLRLGQVHLELGDWPMADAALTRAITKGGLREAGEAEFLLGVSLYGQQRYGEAQAWFEQARAAPQHRNMATRYLEVIATKRQPRMRL